MANILLHFFLIIIFLFSCPAVYAQTTVLGEKSSLSTGASTSIFFSTDAQMNGAIQNDGLLTFQGDVDFAGNVAIGDVAFTGDVDQQLSADSIVIDELTINKEGALGITSNWLVVTNDLFADKGIFSTDQTQFLLLGNTVSDTDRFVEGPMFGLSRGEDMIFPVGVNGLRNYLTIQGTTEGNLVRVECMVPNAEELVPNGDMIGLADEMVWKVSLEGSDSQETQFIGDFSGVDLQNFGNQNVINAFEYDPALAVLVPEDSIFRTLSSIDILDTDEVSFGTIVSNQPITLTNEGITLAVSLIPVQIGPTFFVPNTFSPTATNDQNRVFRPYFTGAEISAISFQVFDAFNNVVHQFVQSGDNIDLNLSHWDGVIEGGDDAPEGVYYFSVNLTAEGEQFKKVGSVLLVK